MASQKELQSTLISLLESRNVYYNPPASLLMKYDAIRYSLSNIKSNYANNNKYKNMKCYDLIVIALEPDPLVVDKILALPYSTMGRPYVSDNLHHYPITLYW